jgi:diadenosine tetraphosphatase ApaH/serine/threonine PP2A family protein phosphatase
MLAHGSPRRPINEYIFPDDMYNSPTKLSASLERFEHLCFVGHTHVPGVFTAGLDFHSPADLDGEYEITEGKALINVGSVGQPRDRDPRAGYVLLRDGKVIFRRVAYDVPTTMNKVYAIQELDDYLGARLEDGR